MDERGRRQWERLGGKDPYWAVLTRPDKRGGLWESGEFFESGRQEIGFVFDRLSALGIAPDYAVGLDFGCGVGRLTRALAQRFKHVVAIDVAESMLREAQRANREWTNIEYRHNTGPTLAAVGDRSVDFIYSNITLQHVPARMQTGYIREFSRVLRPGGVLVFQTPDRPNLQTLRGWAHRVMGNAVLNVARRVFLGPDRVMEMHVLPKFQVTDLLSKLGLAVVDIERYDAAGKAFVSYRYYATAKAEPDRF